MLPNGLPGRQVQTAFVPQVEDEADRLQPIAKPDQLDGQLVFNQVVLPGSNDNRIGDSEATSLWLVDSWQATDALLVTAALRYEDVDSREVRYGDLERTTTSRFPPGSSSLLSPTATTMVGITKRRRNSV